MLALGRAGEQARDSRAAHQQGRPHQLPDDGAPRDAAVAGVSAELLRDRHLLAREVSVKAALLGG